MKPICLIAYLVVAIACCVTLTVAAQTTQKISQAGTTRPAPTTQLSNNQRSLANLRELGRHILVYASENREYLPDSFIAMKTIHDPQPSRETFIDPAAHADEIERIRGLSDEQFNYWLTTKSHYIYVGRPGIKISKLSNWSTLPIAIERGYDKPIAILFLDGHVQLFQPVTTPQSRQSSGGDLQRQDIPTTNPTQVEQIAP